MLVSIIMPVFNSALYIKSAIDSVVSQTYKNWELVIVDDCSTDDSVNVIREISMREPRVKLVHLQANKGAAGARNAGISRSKGRFIAFLDSDDRWHKDKLEKQVNYMVENSIVFSHTGFDRVSEKTKLKMSTYIPPAELTYRQMLRSNKIGCLTAMFDTDYFGKVEMPNIRKRQDYAMWLKLLRQANVVYGLQEVLATYSVRDDSISSNKQSLIKYNYAVFRKCEGLSPHKSLYYLLVNILARVSRGRS